jgi:pimeloyl-ACP methyl ester carboxylesterase
MSPRSPFLESAITSFSFLDILENKTRTQVIKHLFTVLSLLAAASNELPQEISAREEGRLAVSVPLRPQEPTGAIPYDEEEVKYSNITADVTLAGTLTLPRTGKPSPAVLLIAGSGPNDRNETIFGHKPFLVLADHLTKQGFAVLRVDKRGVGQSTGNYDVSTSEDFAADVLAGVEYLKIRNEVDAEQIGLIGHSEGGLIAPMVAVKSNDVAFIVLMAGGGVTGEATLYAQEALISRAMGVTEEQISHQLDFQKQVLSVIKNESDLEKAEKLLREIVAKQLDNLPKEEQQASAEVMEAQIKRCNSKWFRYFLTYDPITSLKHLKIPVLVINGELDSQVPSKQNLPVIAKILEEAGNRNYRIIEFPKLNHLFQTCESGSILEYGKIEETIAPVVLDTLSGWILEITN